MWENSIYAFSSGDILENTVSSNFENVCEWERCEDRIFSSNTLSKKLKYNFIFNGKLICFLKL